MDDPSGGLAREIAAQIVDQVDLIYAQRLDKIIRHLDGLEQRIIEIERGATHTQMLAQQTWAQTHPGKPIMQAPRPTPTAPRPKSIDDACAVPPGEPAEAVRLPRYGATVVPEPGSTPELVWASFINSINTP